MIVLRRDSTRDRGAKTTVANGSQPKRRSVAVWLIPLLLGIFILFFVCSLLSLALIGAKGQPGTIIPAKSADGAAGTSVPIPKDLAASAAADSINLNWTKSSGANVAQYRVYRSEKLNTGYSPLGTVAADTTTYPDKNVSKGITYYYVVTALTAAGAESANSNSASSIIDTPPLVPEGIYSWNAVKTQATADPKYLALLTQVTKLTMNDVNRLADKEKQGQTFKTTLAKGTIVTNSTQDYRILPNYILKTDRDALTDENGTPHVLMKCGNPMKLQSLPPPAIIVRMQVILTTVVNVLPPPVTTVIINAGQATNRITIAVLPEGVLVNLGPTFAPPPGPEPGLPGTKLSDQIIGEWSLPDAPEGFPVSLRFDASGSVSTTVHIGAPGMENFTFDGTYEFTDENHIVIRDTITGISLSYEVSISGDVLNLTAEGSTVSLRRLR
jgi:hypothetical protein